ncbi:ABC transporter permease subunit [Paenibacillus sp. SC116]|uniref:ABC transporter permease subunit n=1 Tax=Paenibacillus sp. SC116 TaxID=2968986 RepID=UPI00215ABD93|nr:ABC transporter permease subunit [Paenibacillus sp. SC116]MCR8846352.1 ABC transporter permease subunit [Paenibacillus sp. SC116]
MRTQIYKTLGLSIVAMILLVLVVLFPRDLDISVAGHEIHAEYHFTWEKYAANIKTFFHGLFYEQTLGPTRFEGEMAETAVARTFMNSLAVIVTSFVLSMGLGILKGIFDYQSSDRKTKWLGGMTTWLFQSIPDFLLILLYQWIILTYFPSIRIFAQEGWEAWVLPTVLLSIYPTFYIARITSASIAAQEGLLYITVAQAKGLSRTRIMYKHVLKNCMSTILSHLSSLFVYMLSNLLIIEYFSNFPGAADRLFFAIDYDTQFGAGANYEPGVIIGISFCFMILLVVAQLVSIVSKNKSGLR